LRLAKICSHVDPDPSCYYRRRALGRSAMEYLMKPLDPEQVMEAVNRLLAYLRPFKKSAVNLRDS